MIYLYIIKNLSGKYYTGITKLKPHQRLVRHNRGDIYSTKFGRPWQLVHVENFTSIYKARKREKQIKS